MHLTWVELRDFRNHAHTELTEIPEGLVVAVGPNGEGKTNLLEAMHVLYALQSPRTATSEAMVRDGAEAGYVRGEFATRDGHVLVEVEVRRRGANRVQVNRSPVRRRRDLRRQVRAVLFGPFDLPVVIGDPAKRRAFMDEVVIALAPGLRHPRERLRQGGTPAEPPAEGVGRPRRCARRARGVGRAAHRGGGGADAGARQHRRATRRPRG